MFEKIVTHNDFDGVVSAAICSYVLGVDKVIFAGPASVTQSRVSITDRDVVCDLPYPLTCGLWFDHHEGNLQELRYRKIDPTTIGGRFALLDSCSRVVYEYFLDPATGGTGKTKLPLSHLQRDLRHFEEAVAEADIIDAFKYTSIEDWRRETPGKIIDCTIKMRDRSAEDKNLYLRRLVLFLRDTPLRQVSQLPEVQERFKRYQNEEGEMLNIIKSNCSFLPWDKNREVIILDLTHYSKQPRVIKNLAYLLYPQALAVVEIHNLFSGGVKTNDLSFSMSLSLNLSPPHGGGVDLRNSVAHNKDVGEIMRSLNIGDGHKGAAAGTVSCDSKVEMLKKKEQILQAIYLLWSNQSALGGAPCAAKGQE